MVCYGMYKPFNKEFFIRIALLTDVIMHAVSAGCSESASALHMHDFEVMFSSLQMPYWSARFLFLAAIIVPTVVYISADTAIDTYDTYTPQDVSVQLQQSSVYENVYYMKPKVY